MKRVILMGALLVLVPATLIAREETGLRVEKMSFCTGVEDRIPVDAANEFPNTLERVYCYTKITGATDTTSVLHNWYYQDEEMASVELAVKSKAWRTWSSKRLLPGWTGLWRVEVVSPTGKVLGSGEFLIKPPSDQ